jgi:hypothetical protein
VFQNSQSQYLILTLINSKLRILYCVNSTYKWQQFFLRDIESKP